MNVTANVLKTAIMSFYRFKKGHWVCTELTYPQGIADVIAIDTKTGEVIEIEVKISKSDLLSENIHKKEKHEFLESYNKTIPAENIHCYIDNPAPNKFYFLVPSYLVDVANDYCEEMNPKYGVLKFNENSHARLPENTITYIRQGRKLHSDNVSQYFKDALIKRVCNDNIVLNRKMYWDKE